MEVSEMKNLVRDLDLTLQPRIAPRYKTWLPLATQQLRLRSLIQIIGYNLKGNTDGGSCWFYYTLHNTSMSSPFYASEPIDNVNPRWASLEVPTLHATGYSTASEIILRLWKRTVADDTSDVTVFTWGISFTGLAYIGPKLPNNLEMVLKENSLIFQFHGGFFTPVYCFITRPDLKRYIYLSMNLSEIKDSYTVNKLTSLRSKMQALKQQADSVQALRLRIASGENFQTPKYPQSSLNRLFQPRKVNREKKAQILQMRKELEMARFRTKLLEQERAIKMGEVRALKQLHSNIMEENQDLGSLLMERYRELNKDIERLHEWRQTHVDTRETYIQISNQLAHRRRQLISELSLIYPIKQADNGKFSINDVHLPDSEDLELSNDTHVAVALGFVAHTTQMIANFLNIPTRYPIIHYGSRSKVVDHITQSLPDNDRQFPLFARSKDRLQFHYAVYLLNKNIAQLRWYCGLPTTDLRPTLSNLATLINIKPNQSQLDNSKRTFSTSSLDTEVGNGKHAAPHTPSIQKIIFEKCHRSSRSISQFKTTKTALGSSLDQGLDRPMQSLVLGIRSKRICKSEESAIDNKTLALARDRLNNSSNETLHGTVSNDRVSTDDANLSHTSNNDVVEDNIEIMIPTSVSKSRNVTDSIESSISMRDRSSNSISSCEMALSGSQNDGEESSNENGMTKSQEASEHVSLIDNNLRHLKSVVDGMEENSENTEDCSSNNSTLRDCHSRNTIKSQNSANNGNLQKDDPFVANYVYSQEPFAKSCLSLDDIMVCNYDQPEHKQRTSSICSYPEESILSKKSALRKRYGSESKSDWEENQSDSERLLPPDISKGNAECNSLLEKASILMQQNTGGCKKVGPQCNYQASSEYIDIIRRSSENVYARTEALANKQSSFKVMKPRL